VKREFVVRGASVIACVLVAFAGAACSAQAGDRTEGSSFDSSTGSGEQVDSTASAITLHPLGAIPDSAGTISSRKKISAPPPGGLPPSVMLTSQFPSPGDQMSEGSCVGWAVAYGAKTFQETVEQGWSPSALNHQFSASWLYNQINFGVDGGSYPSDALNMLVSKGADTLSSFPYVNGDYLTQPNAASFEHASHFTAKSWSTLDTTETAVKNVLASHKPVIIAFQVLPDYDNLNGTTNTVYDDDAGSSRGGHANVLIGYDNAKQAFRMINSWGTFWGDGGYGWLAYSLIGSSKLSASLYVLEDGPNYPIVGDADRDYCVDDADYQLLMNAYNACSPSARYDYRVDFNGDNCVSYSDYLQLLAHWHQGC